ncbi:MAG TPA: hypothetical protein PK264_03520 [Hyphomicrobiaceae bacterium]|nr:hypothetical protein [Hyphomicrobiaceae bacterium]
MSVDLILWLAVAAFAWGLSLVTYRWFALINGWPMGDWQANRPGLPFALGVIAMTMALVFGLARGGGTGLIVPVLGALLALAWTAIFRVGAQASLLLAPLATLALVLSWISTPLPFDPRPRAATSDDRLPARRYDDITTVVRPQPGPTKRGP